MNAAHIKAYLEQAAEVQMPLAPWTSFGVGGLADYLYQPGDLATLKAFLKGLAKAAQADGLKLWNTALEGSWTEGRYPVTVLGLGSNVLVSDRGIRGLTIRMSALVSAPELREDDRIDALAGLPLYDLAAYAAREGRLGFAPLVGIPGSLGGAIWMNAGAYEAQIKDLIETVTVLSLEGEEKVLPLDVLNMSYRHSLLMETGDLIVSASLKAQSGDRTEIYREMLNFQKKRRLSQPLEYPSAGSAFKRPEGHYAGQLIQESGMKGYRGQGCSVSAKHAGFIIRDAGGSATDVARLFRAVQSAVEVHSGIHLLPEVRRFGEWALREEEDAWIS